MGKRSAGLLAGLTSVLLVLVGCSQSASAPQLSASPEAVIPTPTTDAVTRAYVARVQLYWAQHAAARGNALTVCVNNVIPAMCRDRAAALLQVDVQFLSDLDTTRPPPKFAHDDQIFRSQLPKADVELKAMIAAGDSGNKDAVLTASNAYIDAMIPTVTNALDDVDPSQVHT